jgi:signal transduction histidine kinase/CheY-like chemotaxis protein/HPt (histidine-containing phosphotransfer) domain-containing protein
MIRSTEPALRRHVDELLRENAELRERADTDSHSRLMAEEELGRTEDQLRLALNAAGLATWEWDFDSEAIQTSLRFAEILNLSNPTLGDGQVWAPVDLMDRIAADDHAPLQQAVTNVLKGSAKRLEVEFRVRTSEGIRWLECTGEVTGRDMLGRATRLIGVARDVTRRRELQQEIESARAQAVAANSAKDDFLAHISHEIRTPLNGVIGMNNLLAQTELSPEQRQYVELVGSSGRALLALVNDVLDYSRLEAHKLILEQVRFPLKRWLWEVVTPLRVSAEAKGLELLVSASDDLPLEGIGDPGRLRQIVTNLVSNAVKFTQTGHVAVSMAPSDKFAGQLGLCLTVSDTGIGIAADKQHSVFGAFVQADSSTSRRYGGTGLGLSICLKLAQMMGGRIDLESAPGHGSRFTVQVPLALACADTPDTQFGQETARADLNPQVARKVQPSQFPGKRALVVDDHGVNRLLATKLLEQLGFEVAIAADGEAALQAVHDHHFDIVFMDIQMPVMNGWEATHHIRQWEQNAGRTRVPIIALSAHASAADREQALSSGMDGYLSKPLTPEALQAALRATRLAFKASGMDASQGQSDTHPTPLQDQNPQTLPPPVALPKIGLHNRNKMLNRLAGNEAALHEMAQAFCEDLRSCMGAAFEGLKRQDWKVVAAQAHALKGLLLSITAEGAAAHAKALEQAVRQGDAMAAKLAFDELSEAARETFNVVKNW